MKNSKFFLEDFENNNLNFNNNSSSNNYDYNDSESFLDELDDLDI